MRACTLVLVLSFGLTLRAGEFAVTCGSGQYPTLASALAAARTSTPPNRITISGTCSESAVLNWFQDLTLEGVDSAPTLTSANAAVPVLAVTGVHGLLIRNLNFSGQGSSRPTLLSLTGSTNVIVEDCHFAHGANGVAAAVSYATLRRVTAEDMDNIGINARDNSTITTSDLAVSSARIGLMAAAGGQLNLGGKHRIENNRYAGIGANRGSVGIGSCGAGDIVVSGAPYGIQLAAGANAWITCPITVENASIAGVEVGSGGGGNFILAGNMNSPLSYIRSSAVGLRFSTNSYVQLARAVVESNQGVGIALEQNATASIFYSAIRGNAGGGIAVSHASVLMLVDTGVTGNNGWDLVCNTDSHAYGDALMVEKMACPGFAAHAGPKPKPVEPGL